MGGGRWRSRDEAELLAAWREACAEANAAGDVTYYSANSTSLRARTYALYLTRVNDTIATRRTHESVWHKMRSMENMARVIRAVNAQLGADGWFALDGPAKRDWYVRYTASSYRYCEMDAATFQRVRAIMNFSGRGAAPAPVADGELRPPVSSAPDATVPAAVATPASSSTWTAPAPALAAPAPANSRAPTPVPASSYSRVAPPAPAPTPTPAPVSSSNRAAAPATSYGREAEDAGDDSNTESDNDVGVATANDAPASLVLAHYGTAAAAPSAIERPPVQPQLAELLAIVDVVGTQAARLKDMVARAESDKQADQQAQQHDGQKMRALTRIVQDLTEQLERRRTEQRTLQTTVLGLVHQLERHRAEQRAACDARVLAETEQLRELVEEEAGRRRDTLRLLNLTRTQLQQRIGVHDQELAELKAEVRRLRGQVLVKATIPAEADGIVPTPPSRVSEPPRVVASATDPAPATTVAAPPATTVATPPAVTTSVSLARGGRKQNRRQALSAPIPDETIEYKFDVSQLTESPLAPNAVAPEAVARETPAIAAATVVPPGKRVRKSRKSNQIAKRSAQGDLVAESQEVAMLLALARDPGNHADTEDAASSARSSITRYPTIAPKPIAAPLLGIWMPPPVVEESHTDPNRRQPQRIAIRPAPSMMEFALAALGVPMLLGNPPLPATGSSEEVAQATPAVTRSRNEAAVTAPVAARSNEEVAVARAPPPPGAAARRKSSGNVSALVFTNKSAKKAPAAASAAPGIVELQRRTSPPAYKMSTSVTSTSAASPPTVTTPTSAASTASQSKKRKRSEPPPSDVQLVAAAVQKKAAAVVVAAPPPSANKPLTRDAFRATNSSNEAARRTKKAKVAKAPTGTSGKENAATPTAPPPESPTAVVAALKSRRRGVEEPAPALAYRTRQARERRRRVVAST